MRQATYTELTAIIERTSRTRFLSPGDYQFLDNILLDIKHRTLSVNANSALPLIKELKDSLSKVEYRELWPFFYLFIAYANFHLNDLHAARIAAEDAVRKFINDDMNLVLSRWFLAIIYREEGYIKDAREQLEYYALKTLSRIIIQTHEDDIGWKVKKECHLWIDQIKSEIADLPQNETRLFDSARRDQRERIPSADEAVQAAKAGPSDERTAPDNGDDLGTVGKVNKQTDRDAEESGRTRGDGGEGLGSTDGTGKSGGDGGKSGNDPSSRKNDSSPMNLHINIPIDIRSTDYVDQTSMPYLHTHHEQSTNQDQDAIFITSTPVDVNMVDFTQPLVLQTSDKANPDDSFNESNTSQEILQLDYLMTPSFPIYGKASAGPDGQVLLEEPNFGGATDESSCVRIDGQEYDVHTLKHDDHQVDISYRDFILSILPKKLRKNGGKAYGWLKVVGNSMNNAEPTPIDEDDYVLFYENRIPTAGKIVIAAESTPASGATRLLIKQLIKIKERFFLHSMSHGKDPNTERDYVDLEVDDCYQLIGEVVAVAKLRKPKAQ
jgi:hypothetical protein